MSMYLMYRRTGSTILPEGLPTGINVHLNLFIAGPGQRPAG